MVATMIQPLRYYAAESSFSTLPVLSNSHKEILVAETPSPLFDKRDRLSVFFNLDITDIHAGTFI